MKKSNKIVQRIHSRRRRRRHAMPLGSRPQNEISRRIVYRTFASIFGVICVDSREICNREEKKCRAISLPHDGPATMCYDWTERAPTTGRMDSKCRRWKMWENFVDTRGGARSGESSYEWVKNVWTGLVETRIFLSQSEEAETTKKKMTWLQLILEWCQHDFSEGFKCLRATAKHENCSLKRRLFFRCSFVM